LLLKILNCPFSLFQTRLSYDFLGVAAPYRRCGIEAILPESGHKCVKKTVTLGE